MSKYLMLLLATASLTLTACGKDSNNNGGGEGNNAKPLNKAMYPNVPQTIYGQWKSNNDDVDKGTTFKTSIFVNQDTVGVEIVCDRGFEKATASLSVKARITQDTVEILEGGTASKKEGNITCSANMKPSRFGYQVNGNGLTLFADGNKGQLGLTRIQ